MPSGVISARSDVGDDYLTPREVSALAKVTEKTLANWRSLGIGPAYTKLSSGRGGRIRYPRLGVLRWLSGDRATEAA